MAGHNLKILLVEDSKAIRADLLATLVKYGADVTQAENGAAGWLLLQDLKRNNKKLPDVIISDINMPEMSGLQLLEKVRNDSRCKKLPFIILTSNKEELLKMTALCLDVTAFYIKPPNTAQLYTQLDKLRA